MPNGIGGVLKGIGKAIGRGVKKIPGRIYREGIKPEAKRILEKFTEAGPATGRPISREPQAGTTTAPFEEGPKGFRGPTAEERARQREITRKKRLPAKILSPAEQVSKPAPTIKEQVKAASYPLAGGRTGAYDPSFTGMGAVDRLRQRDAARKARETKPRLERGTPDEKAARAAAREKAIRAAVKTTTAKPLTDQTTLTGRTKDQARGSIARYRTPPVTATAKPPAEKKAEKRREVQLAAAQKQRARLIESRKGKGGKRTFSGRKTTAEIGKAARASQKEIEIDRLDTTAQEVARMMTEQEVGREAERAEAALKGGRKPTREKARYRYQTRGYKRSEGRGR